VGKAMPAAAADGANVVAGTTVTAEHPTEIHSDAITTTPCSGLTTSRSTRAITGAGTFAGPCRVAAERPEPHAGCR
jgi:hypothetical protein